MVLFSPSTKSSNQLNLSQTLRFLMVLLVHPPNHLIS
jgi:hypothetical protein